MTSEETTTTMTSGTCATCARCGEEGQRGDHPGEGRIVHGGGETALGEYSTALLCDDCADELTDDCAASQRGQPVAHGSSP